METTTCYSLLLADDDPSFRDSIKRIVHSLRKDISITIKEASSGDEAASVLKEHDIDCILLDHQMPGRSGLEWMDDLKQLRPHSSIIMITGVGTEEIAVQAMKSGAMDYLIKGSLNPHDMKRAILNALQKREMLKTIKHQQDELLNAERHRVMIESLGAACHHLAQPLTVLSCFIEMIHKEARDNELQVKIQECQNAMDQVQETLDRFRHVTTYRTEPYLPDSSGSDQFILKI